MISHPEQFCVDGEGPHLELVHVNGAGAIGIEEVESLLDLLNLKADGKRV